MSHSFHILNQEGIRMDERERLRRRREALMNARRQGHRAREEKNAGKDLFLFRTYVTMMIVGLAIALSFIETESAQKTISSLKQAIAYQIPFEDIRQAGIKAVGAFQKGKLPIEDLKKKQKEESNKEELMNEVQQKDTDTSLNFEPDLSEEEEIP